MALRSHGSPGGSGTGVNGSEDAIEKGKPAIQSGINHIDTAQLYKTERETGESIKRIGLSKDHVYVMSKRKSTRNVMIGT
ncbi:hypothetical protein D9756_005781 [Leucocoprinus leucothites]|uniref:NADP-dependent oxidoreductase domain-containing protein n=1 Tax=Leucocoprinus leucothites TaxID=201217 RepID=A0A8H5FZV0_9AGAR|nr:hypothetical protein D9756_005781 [Leucoagaricus leucothites]